MMVQNSNHSKKPGGGRKRIKKNVQCVGLSSKVIFLGIQPKRLDSHVCETIFGRGKEKKTQGEWKL